MGFLRYLFDIITGHKQGMEGTDCSGRFLLVSVKGVFPKGGGWSYE